MVDEADLVLSFGYADDIRAVTKRLPKICQGFLMSATLSAELEDLKRVVLHRYERGSGGRGGGGGGGHLGCGGSFRPSPVVRALLLFFAFFVATKKRLPTDRKLQDGDERGVVVWVVMVCLDCHVSRPFMLC